MRTFGLVLALLMVCGSVAFAALETVDFDVYSGWNQIASPLVPVIASGDPPTPDFIFGDIPIAGLLSRWDPTSGGIDWDDGDPNGFGCILLGDGYQLRAFAQATVTVEGVPDGVPDGDGVKTDMWISLPGNQNTQYGAWHLIGQPFNHDTPVDDGSGTGSYIMFTDGTTLKNWGDAVTAHWVSPEMSGWNAVGGGFSVSFDGGGDDWALRATRGYWLQTYVPNLAMIIPATPVAEE